MEALVNEGRQLLSGRIIAPRNQIEADIEEVWRTQIGGVANKPDGTYVLSVKENFFTMGGDSLKAGQVVNAMRKKFKINLSVSDLFASATIEALSAKISSVQQNNSSGGKETGESTPSLAQRLSRGNLTYDATKETWLENKGSDPEQGMHESTEINDHPLSLSLEMVSLDSNEGREKNGAYKDIMYTPENPNKSTHPITMMLQLLPTLIFYPLRKVAVWFFISYPWVLLMNAGWDRFWALVIAIISARVILSIFWPLVGVVAKWVIVGRYKAGCYPLWGSMYLRWWLVEQILQMTGKGVFQQGNTHNKIS